MKRSSNVAYVWLFYKAAVARSHSLSATQRLSLSFHLRFTAAVRGTPVFKT